MRKTQEERSWDSLNKEYRFLFQLANRTNAPKIERDYYARMANYTLARRNGIRLPKRRGKDFYQPNNIRSED
jgi:hypothetical protein